MIKDLRIAIAQINHMVGALAENCTRITQIWTEWEGDADLIVFPEMIVTGYPVEDLVFHEQFLADIHRHVEALTEHSRQHQSAILIGAPWKHQGKLYNAGFLIERGQRTLLLKHDLPNDGVFDEERLFSHGPLPEPALFRGHKLGIMICQDFWSPRVAGHLKDRGAECLIIPNGSTYETTKYERRLFQARKRVTETGLPLLYVNAVGGQDELVFDGASFLMSPSGEVIFQMRAFEEDIRQVTEDTPESVTAYPPLDQTMYNAAVLGLRDYIHKSGFSSVLLGLSGGIDSALAASIAVDALGADNVRGVRLPSPFTSQESLDDAQDLAHCLGIQCDTIPIDAAMTTFQDIIPDLTGLAFENMQARSRGLILMSLSNQSGALLLSTGNKSELATGYATLYGDMCGAFNPLKDMYKTKVYDLSRLRNGWKPSFAKGPDGPVIPENILTKAPSAELRPDQKDEDSLPPYEILDPILERLIEGEESCVDVTKDGVSADIVTRVYKLLRSSEYKRRQACPGVNLTTKAFGGRARRYP
ncbi:MAG: NAD+ synthase, partial [Rhodospirillales bacterium]|nr:NAD+ synthase [Rhodospirillales bacterium]